MTGSLLVALMALPAVARTAPAATITEPLRAALAAADPATPIQIMVTFEDRAAQREAARTFGERPGIALQAIPVLAFAATPAEIRALSRAPGVRRLELDPPAQLLLPSATVASRVASLRTGPDPVRVDGRPVDGRGVGIAVVDNGIDATHPDLRARTVFNARIVSDRLLREFLYGSGEGASDTFVEVGDGSFGSGHGTHVAGIALGDGTATQGRVTGVAPGARLYGFGIGAGRSVLTSFGAAAFDWILAHHDTVDPPIRVVNNSWAGDGAFDPDDPVDALADLLVAEGIVVVWGAGNGDELENGGVCADDRVNSHAKNPTPGVLSVGNYDDRNTGTRDGDLHRSSSRGLLTDPTTWPDLVAPGTSITSPAAPASEDLALAVMDYVFTLGYSDDPNPVARPLLQHRGTVRFELDGAASPAADLDWLTWTQPAAIFDAHRNAFEGADGAEPRFFHADASAGPLVQPSGPVIDDGDLLHLTKQTGASNPIRIQVVSPSGTAAMFSVRFACASGPCSLGVVTFLDGTDRGGVASIRLADAFAGEPSKGTWIVAPAPPDHRMGAFDPSTTAASGTSMSSPHVAGIVALLLDAAPHLQPGEIEPLLEDTAYRFDAGGPYTPDPANLGSRASCRAGHGLVDARAAVLAALAA